MTEPARWQRITSADPGHSTRYINRFKQLAANGFDLFGEARAADAMLARGSVVVDAGCGPGRISVELAQRSHRVVGLDIDPLFITEGRRVAAEHGVAASVGDDGALEDVPEAGQVAFKQADITQPFGLSVGADLILCAGNVITFLDAPGPAEFLRHAADALAEGGRIIIGFGLTRGYSLAQYEADLAAAGLIVQSRFATWQFEPFTDESDFVVDILARR
ncbi:hypothetical protein BSZ39_03340 [Bowdeniella nasicola]|uniref:Methyltransferase domain-containing protein n=1 Tax=Bowdeniella nasicola TaxID=208480 RepID=A0A1Q5Q433_9ACTO|nr:class I SAM-dependent methyltransferase [Bowdeniella nasicola]OKL54574.1 hypothetical protein BSZ39_03340 [Bowdeniella nasicola]